MAFYRYEALDDSGNVVQGTMDAGTPAELRANLRQAGLHTRKLDLAVAKSAPQPATAATSVASTTSNWYVSGARLALLSEFSRHLALLLRSGLPLTESLAVMSDHIEHTAFREVIRDVNVRVREGATLDAALTAHPKYFPEFFICVARAGLASGRLAEVLSAVGSYFARQKRLRDKVISALTYPFLMMFVGINVIVFLMAYVVPRVTTVLLEQRQTLPWPTEVLLFISNFAVNWWWLLIVLFSVCWLLIRQALRSPAGRMQLDGLLLRTPVVGNLVRKQAVARWADTMSNLMASGIPVLQSLSIVKNVLGNKALVDEVTRLEKAVIEGGDLSAALKTCRYLPRSLGFVVAVGEETGDLPRVLGEVAESYNEEVEVMSSRLAELVNPVMIVFLGLAVGFIVAAILLPITDFGQIQ
jgi:general secretion pathway protein F